MPSSPAAGEGEPGAAHVTTGAAATPADAAAPAVELRGITKVYGTVVACDAVDLAVRRGEIHGLLGENGAGKSTLMKVLLGLVRPDAGRVLVDGAEQTIRSPLDAAALGIAMVHQHFSLVPALTVWENVVLGERTRVDRERARRVVRDVGDRYGLHVDPDARVADLTTGERQRVEILKCLARDPGVLVLDEPTSVLTLAESREMFAVLRRVVQDERRAVVLISHKLDEVLDATDLVTVMRAGAVVARRRTSETDARDLVRAMVGRELSNRAAPALGALDASTEPEPTSAVPGTSGRRGLVLRISDAHAVGVDGRALLRGLSLDVAAGEILGLAGVEGNGQVALRAVLSSLLPLTSGSVHVRGVEVATGRPGAMLRAGVGVVPEDRQRAGCVLDMTVAENLVLADSETVSTRGFVSRRRLYRRAEQLVEEFDIDVPSLDAPMRAVSGGNQQKIVLARELARQPKVLVAAQPAAGLDVGASEYMTRRLRAAAEQGVAVLLVSTELAEVLALADRVAVIVRGTIVGEMARADVEVERLGLLMGGQAA
jgi:general nucleoside transport system ATP-binding protein